MLIDAKVDPPFIFELVTTNNIRSYCGVLEFSARQGQIVLPSSLMTNLMIEEGEKLQVRCVHLPRGTDVLLQPHSVSLLSSVDNDRSKMVSMLQWVLPSYATLTMGDTIQVEHRGVQMLLNIIECKPAQAICIVADPYIDINIDFTPALDYVDPDAPKAIDPLALGKKELADDDTEEEESDQDMVKGQGLAINEPSTISLRESQV